MMDEPRPASRPFSADTATFLASTPLFQLMDEAALREVESEVERVSLPGGATLMRQGDPGDSLYVVLNGRFRVTVTQPDGREQVVGEVGRGESVGEMAILTGEQRSATVRAVRDTEVLKLSKAGFDRLVRRSPETAIQLARLLVKRLQQQLHPPRAVHAPATIAVLPAGRETAVRDFAGRLATALSTIGPTLHLDSARIESYLGQDASSTHPGDVGHRRIVGWLTEAETRHQFVLYEADPAPSPWTSRCLRQADRILLVGRAGSPPAIGETEIALWRREPGTPAAPVELVLLYDGTPGAPSATRDWLRERHVAMHHHVRVGVPDDFARLARMLTGRAVGLVLGGGGARAFAHIGVVRALQEARVPIDLVGGASMGAVIAAQHALGWDHETMLRATRRAFVESGRLFDYTIPVVSLIRGRRIFGRLADMFGDVRIEDLWLKYFCVTSNLTRAEVAVHEGGPLVRFLAASISVPALGPPLFDHGNLHVDGSVLNALPADVMKRFGRGPVVAVQVTPRVELTTQAQFRDVMPVWPVLWNRLNPFAPKLGIPSIVQILLRTVLLGSIHSAEEAKRRVDLYIHPPVDGFDMFDWKSLDRIVEAGYTSARDAIQGSGLTS